MKILVTEKTKMICNKCKMAADGLEIAKLKYEFVPKFFKSEEEKFIKDAIGLTKTLHAQCKGKDCFCQHRITF